MKQSLKLITLILGALAMLGCAASKNNQILSQTSTNDFSNMYLRGIFNWWEATPFFKLQPVGTDKYSVTFELIADGQPYDFKVADANWSMQLNCGNEFGADEIKLDQKRTLICASDSVNLQFTPQETSNYQFVLDVSDNQQPTLVIRKVES